MRLGELLVEAGLISMEQVEQTLRAQVMWGGRFGTNLVELGFVGLDILSRVLGRQHERPAAFARHFDNADPALQALVPAELAAQFTCVPLMRIGEDRVVVAAVAPLGGRARALLAHQLGISYKGIIPAVAPELRVRYHLERVYGIPRPTRFLRTSKHDGPAPSFEIDVDMTFDSDPELEIPIDVDDMPVTRDARHKRARTPEIELSDVDLIPENDAIPEELPEVDEVAIQVADPTSNRQYVRTLADELDDRSGPKAVARIEIKRQPIGAATLPAVGRVPATLGEAARAIRRAGEREAVAQRVIDTVARFVQPKSAVLLVVRGDAAMGWTGYRHTGEPLPEIAVPIDQPGLVTSVVNKRVIARSASGNLGAIDFLLLDTLGMPNGDLVVVPISIGEHVWCVIALATEPGAALESLETISNAAAAAFARLMRDSNR